MIGIEDAEKVVGIDLVLELAKHTVERSNQPVRSFGSKVPRIEDTPGGAHGGVDELDGELMLPQETVERRIARNARCDRLDLGLKHQIGATLANGRSVGRTTTPNERRNSKQNNKLPAHQKPAVYVMPYGCGNRVNA